jgi:CYTH domain-containing protein/CHAD domain-containing protein
VAYVLDPGADVADEVWRVRKERLGDAIELLDAVIARTADVESAVHDVRKRCKEMRGLARLVRPALGKRYEPFNRHVRDAANELSALRDAHALAATFDTLLSAHELDDQLRSVRDRQVALAAAATASIEAGDERIAAARELLIVARDDARAWTLDDDFDPLGQGLAATYRAGRQALRRARYDPTDEHVHEWRKAVKYLWYQTRLLHDAAPSVLGPMVEQLDALAEALGDDHDLAVMVAALDAEPDRFGEPDVVDHARRIARDQQDAMRTRAFRAGASVYAERPTALRERVTTYWRVAADRGPELLTGGIATLAAASRASDAAPRSSVERERKFLVEAVPDDLDLSDCVELRQGYLLADEHASVRVRDAAREGCTLTVKAGSGAERLELEWTIDRDQFDAAWTHTDGRRVVKIRHRIAFDNNIIELDVFAGELTGLVVAEVEFASLDALDAFEPPPWFGRELTDDGRYTNAALALQGRPV